MIAALGSSRRLPMIFQAQTNECGLACLAMVSGFHGQGIGLDALRSRLGSSALGTSASQLLALADRLKLRGRALKIELNDLSQLSLPAILHWDLDHYVVLKKVGSHTALIHDPAVGVRKYQLREMSSHFTGVALELNPQADFSRRGNPEKLRLAELLSGVSITRASIGLVFVMTLLLQVLAILNPLYLQLVIDQGLIKGDTELILLLALLFAGLLAIKTLLAHLRASYLLHFGNRIGLQLLGSVASHLSQLPLGYFERREMGDIVSRFGSLENIRRMITQEMITVVVDGLFSLLTLILLFLYSPVLGSTVLVAVSIFALVRISTLNKERELRHESLITTAKQQTRFMENIRSASVAKTHGIESLRHNDWERNYTEQLNSGWRLDYFQLSLGSVQSVLFGLENIITVYLGASAVITGKLTLGQLMSFIFLKQHFISSVMAMLPKLSDIRLLGLDLERIADVVQHKPESAESDQCLFPAPSRSDVELQALGFSYNGADALLFENLNHIIEPGQFAAVTGPSGCGKSTLLKLLSGLESPTRGTIRIGGRDIKQINRQDLRTHISAVMHGDGLLAGDLAYNIHLDKQPIDWDWIRQLSAMLGIDALVERLPLGYAAEIGELGSVLSAGQIQRILLARALYRKPKILLLDETLSNLNTTAALTILRAIRQTGITLVFVTHNPDLLSEMDVIVQILQPQPRQ